MTTRNSRKVKPVTFFLLLLALSSGAWQVNLLSAEESPDAVVKWEYRVLTEPEVLAIGKHDFTAGLNTLGEQGWELIAIDVTNIFKRPTQQRNIKNLEAQVAAVKAKLAMQRNRVVRSQLMADKGYQSQKEFEAERHWLKVLEIDLATAQQELKSFQNASKTNLDQEHPANPASEEEDLGGRDRQSADIPESAKLDKHMSSQEIDQLLAAFGSSTDLPRNNGNDS